MYLAGGSRIKTGEMSDHSMRRVRTRVPTASGPTENRRIPKISQTSLQTIQPLVSRPVSRPIYRNYPKV